MPVSLGAVEYCDDSCHQGVCVQYLQGFRNSMVHRWSLCLKLIGSKQIWSLGIPLLLSVDSTKMKLFIHGVASWTGLMTLAASIFSISCRKVCFRWDWNGSAGCVFGVVMDGLRWIWYGSPGNLAKPLKSSGYCSWICSFDFTILTLPRCVFLGYCRGRSWRDGCCRLCMYFSFGMIGCTGYKCHSGGKIF